LLAAHESLTRWLYGEDPMDRFHRLFDYDQAIRNLLAMPVSESVRFTVSHAGASGITYAMENTSDRDYEYGGSFNLLKWENGTWVLYEPSRRMIFALPSHSLPARGSTQEYMIDFVKLWDSPLPSGRYRFVKIIFHNREPLVNDFFIVSYDFTIYPDRVQVILSGTISLLVIAIGVLCFYTKRMHYKRNG
jgi:hypothetical protein